MLWHSKFKFCVLKPSGIPPPHISDPRLTESTDVELESWGGGFGDDMDTVIIKIPHKIEGLHELPKTQSHTLKYKVKKPVLEKVL